MRLPDSILEVLQDGEPHHARELSERTNLTLKELDGVMNFLVKYGFAAKLGENVRIESQFGSLLRELYTLCSYSSLRWVSRNSRPFAVILYLVVLRLCSSTKLFDIRKFRYFFKPLESSSEAYIRWVLLFSSFAASRRLAMISVLPLREFVTGRPAEGGGGVAVLAALSEATLKSPLCS